MKVNHHALKKWVEEMAELCQPDKIHWMTGTDAEKEALEKEACNNGELIALDKKKWPGCFYHRSDPNDVARTEHLTFICTPSKDDAGPTNNWMAPKEAYHRGEDLFKGSMRGRTMYVIPFSMGWPGSSFAKYGVQLTDSIYVVLNMRIMTHAGAEVLRHLGRDGTFTRCLHSKADLNENRRLILHFPQDNTIWSVGSGYGGNALLGKKCLALRLASAQGRDEGWLAEHMLIMGIQDPQGHTTYLAAAFPSACGKTNLAMLIPPEPLKKLGYKIWTVGDDIAWLRTDSDGQLWAMNPEAGMFGVVPGTNARTNPQAMETISRDTLFTNVVLAQDRTVWWEGADGAAPESGYDWRGRPWKPGEKDASGHLVAGAHPNSRFTAPIDRCPALSPHYKDPRGVKISAIIFGARRRNLAPLVYEARSWQHGVYIGATMASERTAAQVGKVGEVRRDPFAMMPFCGYNMGDYFRHWLRMGENMLIPPKIFRVNWFRRNDDGEFLWPGYGENLRILLWMVERCRYRVPMKEMPYGGVPYMKDINLDGLDMTRERWDQMFAFDSNEWLQEADHQRDFLLQFGDRLPSELLAEDRALRARLEHARRTRAALVEA